MAFSNWDLGACNCDCQPCALPAADLHLAYDGTAFGYGTTEATLTNTGPGQWLANYLVDNGLTPQTFQISCSAGCSVYQMGGTNTYDIPAGCSHAGGGALYLISSSCSPLNLVFANPSLPPHITWTITP